MAKDPEIVVEKAEYPHPALERIETERKGFLSVYKRNNTLKTIVTVVCFVLIILAFIIIPTIIKDNAPFQQALTIIIAAVGLGGTLVYSFLTRKSLDRKMRVYFDGFYKNTNEYVLDSKNIKNIKYEPPGKINLEQFTDCGLYKDVIEVGSRGFTEFEYGKIPVAVCDCAGNIKAEKRMKPVFVGKYLFAPASYKGKTPVIVFLRGNERSLPPTNVEGNKIVEEDAKVVIRSNSKNWKEVLTPEVRKIIDSIKTNNLLVDLAISVKEGRMFVLMGYDDPIMILPLMDKYDSKPYEQYKKDLAKILKLVEALNK